MAKPVELSSGNMEEGAAGNRWKVLGFLFHFPWPWQVLVVVEKRHKPACLQVQIAGRWRFVPQDVCFGHALHRTLRTKQTRDARGEVLSWSHLRYCDGWSALCFAARVGLSNKNRWRGHQQRMSAIRTRNVVKSDKTPGLGTKVCPDSIAGHTTFGLNSVQIRAVAVDRSARGGKFFRTNIAMAFGESWLMYSLSTV